MAPLKYILPTYSHFNSHYLYSAVYSFIRKVMDQETILYICQNHSSVSDTVRFAVVCVELLYSMCK